MPGRAKPESLKNREYRQAVDDLLNRAAAAYRLELDKPPRIKRRSSRKIAADFERIYKEETGKDISINHNTVVARAKGRKSRLAAAQLREWLESGEAEIVINHAIQSANQGFPLTHRRLKEDVDRIVRARLGDRFPETGVGKKWTQRFIEKHSDRLKTGWSTALETKRANAVNPHTNDAWWSLLGTTLEDYSIDFWNIYGVDECGCQPYGADRERVIGPKRKGPQYQQRTGNRENITVIVVICADGSSLPPAIIFKGKGYMVKWKQDNPANASIGYSKKGWTTAELGVLWLKIYDQQTAKKANGGWRLLLVDGHNSHYSLEFLEYARDHKIMVLCYPSHTTHIYQGLDVVIFAVLKQKLSSERDEFVRKHAEEITKENFLGIYGRAHIATLSTDNVKAAFQKTGVHPYNPSVVTEENLAPSRPQSIESNLPVAPPTPIKIMARMLQNLSLEEGSSMPLAGIGEGDEDSDGDVPSPTEVTLAEKRRRIVEASAKELLNHDIGYLIGQQRVSSLSPMFHPTAQRILPSSVDISSLLSITPKTKTETMLIAALREVSVENKTLKHRVIELQASNILNETYCNKLRFQLASKEKKGKGGKGKGKLMGDGLPQMLTGDEFYQRVVKFTEWQKQEEVRKAKKADVKVLWKEEVKKWEKEKERVKAENILIDERNKKAEQKWKNAQTAAKRAKKSFKQPKPTKEPKLPVPKKPTLKAFQASLEADEDSDSSLGDFKEESEEEEEESDENDE